MTVSELSAALNGVHLSGPPDRVCLSVQSLADAGAGDISFFGNEKYLPALRSTRAGVVLVPESVGASLVPMVPQSALIAVTNPSLAFADVMARLAPPAACFHPGIHPSAVIAADADLDPDTVSIGPHAVIEGGVTIGRGTTVGAGSFLGEGVTVGEGCHFHPRVTVLRHCRLGSRVTLHSGVVIGADGFGFEQLGDGRRVKIPQLGIVVVEDDVEIGANTCIDRARFGQTTIGAGTKIDNLVQIAHNVRIGKNCVIAGQSGIAGSSRLHDNVTLAAQVGVAGHLEIASGVTVTAQSGVGKSLREPGIYMGDHADPMRRTLRIMAARQRLPELLQRVRALEKDRPPTPSSDQA